MGSKLAKLFHSKPFANFLMSFDANIGFVGRQILAFISHMLFYTAFLIFTIAKLMFD